MRKLTFCICENKGTDQRCSNCEADQRLCFRNLDSTISLLSKSKILVLSYLLCLYSSLCVGSVRKPHCWFSHDEAHQWHFACIYSVIQIMSYRDMELNFQGKRALVTGAGKGKKIKL